MRRELVAILLLPAAAAMLLFAYGCGDNPPFAPFGATVSILNPPVDISLPCGTQEVLDLTAVVEDIDGFPLNDVKVDWMVSFAGTNSLVYDTDGDGIADARAVQLVNPDGCEEVGLDCALVDSSLYAPFGAFVDSPFLTKTNNTGRTRVLIMVFGDFPVDPANVTVSIGTAVDVADFRVTGCGE